jgi:hypothetical protein
VIAVLAGLALVAAVALTYSTHRVVLVLAMPLFPFTHLSSLESIGWWGR